MEFRDTLELVHPIFVVAVVFPLIGIAVSRALQVRQRRQQTTTDGKSKIPPGVGQEHVRLGRWLTGAVVGATLMSLANDILGNILDEKVWSKNPLQVFFIGLLFAATISSLVLLYLAKPRQWRAIYATLTGMGLVIIGFQSGVYQNLDNWYMSHFIYGMIAAMLMIFSLAIVPDIYRDKKNRWRKVHVFLNSIALLVFLEQAVTGTRSLLEIPLSWQEPYIMQLSDQHCDTKPCTIQAAPALQKPK
ncbi:MAG: DUF4079 domain-containing protein [Chroococcidiopsidaceae cyanobacterium CP_BM_RX_35]|nr:DUF4079 domain-containing protein [Chroococcidiopsidaceae cyanobacterium CP_BM_RX_35]